MLVYVSIAIALVIMCISEFWRQYQRTPSEHVQRGFLAHDRRKQKQKRLKEVKAVSHRPCLHLALVPFEAAAFADIRKAWQINASSYTEEVGFLFASNQDE